MVVITGVTALGGCISVPPPLPVMNCALEAKRTEEETNNPKMACFVLRIVNAPMNQVTEIFAAVSQRLPEFKDSSQWIQKIQQMVLASKNPRIKALSFVPTHPEKNQTWLLNKEPELEDISQSFMTPFDGYYGTHDDPDLETPDSALSLTEATPISLQSKNDDIERSTQDVPRFVQKTVRKILENFSEDRETKGLAITIQDRVDHCFSLVFRKTPSYFI